jgi:alkaline phosphatase D
LKANFRYPNGKTFSNSRKSKMIRNIAYGLLLAFLSAQLFAAEFASDFDAAPDRVWLGSAYWANPMENWEIKDGRLECLGGANHNVALLTHALTGKDDFAMSVRLGKLSNVIAGKVGFRIGLQDEIPDYRAAALRGRGLDVGVIAGTGTLFIGKKTGGKLAPASLENATLLLTGDTADEKCTLKLTANSDTGRVLAEMESTVAANDATGLVALVSDHKTAKFWFADWKLSGKGVAEEKERAFGPILWSMHTLHHSHSDDGAVLKLTAQLVPLGKDGPKTAKLGLSSQDKLVEAEVDPLSCTATFRVPGWDTSKSVQYTVHFADTTYTGTIRPEPQGRPLVVAGFTGNTDYLFPNRLVVGNVESQDPDVLFFSGDQLYEGVGGYGIVRAPTDTADAATIRRATLNYLRKWYLFGWAFGDLMRDRPTVCLPDDHDVYQGNIWGEGGLNPHGIRNHAKGGFAEHPEFVNAVIRMQCSHHPDLPDPAPMKQGIHVFFGDMNYGRVSFAILEDRYFKSGPEGKVNTWKGRPDHMTDPDYDVSKLDKEGLELLGERQEKFLEDWAADWRGADFKCVLSQTIFCNLANYHGPSRQFIFADLDSNGWPQSKRDEALRIMRKGYAFHYAGDQHLPSITQYGIDTWGDAGYAFCVPSIAAGYPRSWLPDKEGRPVQNRPKSAPANTGEYRDGFGNYVTVFGIGNPADKNRRGREDMGHDKSSGHGIVRFDSDKQTITMECYRLQIDPKKPTKENQFPGWPLTIKLMDNRGHEPTGILPEITAPAGVTRPVLRVWEEKSGKLVYALRLAETKVKPWVYAEGRYNVELGDPDADNWTKAQGVSPE